MFGTEAAFNLNSSLYDWNNSVPGVYIFFNTDDTEDTEATATGTNFTAGSIVLAGGAGVILGAAAATALSKIKRKRKENEAA